MHRSQFLFLLIMSACLSGCGLFKPEEELGEDATVEEFYAFAKESLDNGDWLTAVERLQQLEARYPYGVYAEQAKLDTIYAYYRSDESALAISAADRFIKLHPTHRSVDYAYYLKGQASFEEDDSILGVLIGQDDLSDRDPTMTLNALRAFEEVYTLFPDSQYAPSARERVRYLRDTLSRHELSIARYYFARKAYVATVNRAREIVEEYSNTPAVEEALGLLVASYTTMGLPELAEDSRRVLALNFPDSEYLGASVQFAGARYTDPRQMDENENPGLFSRIRNFFRGTLTD